MGAFTNEPDPEGALRSKDHPLLMNPYVQYPYRWKAAGKGGHKQRTAKERPFINVIGHRLDSLLAVISEFFRKTPLPSLEVVWENFLSAHANPNNVQYPSLAEMQASPSDAWPPFTPGLTWSKTLGGHPVDPEQLLPWLYFARKVLLEAIQAARKYDQTLPKEEQLAFTATLYTAYKFSSY